MQLLVALVATVAGAIASLAGFGIGSLLTPLFATVVDMRAAVAAGGLVGALLGSHASSSILTIVFGALLTFVGISGISGLAERMRFRGIVAWIAGAASGVFGGLVGNQGGIRSAALLGFKLQRDAFVATATAIALLVDIARMPVYVVTERQKVAEQAVLLVIATIGVIVGTFVGTRLLRRIPEHIFKRIVAILVLALGVYMTGKGAHWWA